jgi:hypothetical protein
MIPFTRSVLRVWSVRAVTAVVAASSLMITAAPLLAATPSSGAVSASNSPAWRGGPLLATAADTCGGPSGAGCDHFRLTIQPPAYSFQVEITLTPQLADDWDLEVYGPDGSLVGDSGNTPGSAERVVLNNPAAGTYTVSASPYVVTGAYSAKAEIRESSAPPPTASTPLSSERAPRYANYTPPAGQGAGAGEPTLGVNERTGAVMYIAGTETLKAQFDACTSPAKATWTDQSFLTTSQATFDPILFTDQELGRTFVSQLLPTKISLMAFTDNDGLTWTPSQGAGFNSGVDHQSVGGGPFAPGGLLRPVTDYPHAVYYCSQDLAYANCAVSLDGGLTFGPAVPMYTLDECVGIHGHVKVGPDGAVYVPNRNCGGEQAVVVSTDSGLTWDVRPVPGSAQGRPDPSVAIARDGTVYLGWADGNKHPFVAVSHDQGLTWTNIRNVGTRSTGLPYDIQNVAFPAMVAGDGDRAAFAFLGTPTAGDGGADDPDFPAEWHLYIAHTYDGGNSWVTVDVTPTDPVQRGTICMLGTVDCSLTRNLLDFNDATLDAQGRVLVSYADGCTGSCVQGPPNSYSELATIARQASGKSLYAEFDSLTAEGPPGTPALDAVLRNGAVQLAWSVPDDRGSAITAYRLYRRNGSGSPVLLQSFGPAVHAYSDPVGGSTAYSYRVTAVNARGESAPCGYVAPVVPDPETERSSCVPPGPRVYADPGDDAPSAALDIQSLSIAEVTSPEGKSQLVFTVKVRDLQTILPGHAWMVLWNRPQADATHDRNYVVMRANADGTVGYKHGRLSPPNVNQATDLGDLDAGSFTTGGTITLTVSTDKVDGVAAGQDLSVLQVRSFAAHVSGLPAAQNVSADYSAEGSYTLKGSAACGGNRAPTAAADSAATPENKPVQIAVLGNDTDPEGDALTLTGLGTPAHGRVVAKRDGTVSYKPNSGFTGTDRFTYTVDDGNGHTATAEVTVTVNPR